MQRTAAAGTDALLDINRHILARQMVGECVMPRRWSGNGDCKRWMAGLCPRDIGVEVFQAEGKLVTIEPFRPASKLRALQALDDEPEPLHLGTRRSKLGVIL